MHRSLVLALVLLAGCPHGGTTNRPYPAPTAETITARLAAARTAMTGFRGDSTMDYWLSGQRAKGEVLVMGQVGKKVRFAALSPAGGSTLAEMACDGTSFVYLDYQNNCMLTGPCDARSIATFFNIELEPDDFIHLALGTPPTLDGATGTVTWDASKGVEKIALQSSAGSQKLTIDGKNDHWDVLSSELLGPDGKQRWSVANTDFEKVTGSGDRRVPKKTRFKSPAQSQDLLVEWSELEVNPQLDPEKFHIDVPAGLSTCGQKP
jgi:outer membrane lipoprotein-sorting protein